MIDSEHLWTDDDDEEEEQSGEDAQGEEEEVDFESDEDLLEPEESDGSQSVRS